MLTKLPNEETVLESLDPAPASWRVLLGNLDRGSRWLTMTGFLMLLDMFLCIAGLIADPSIVSGAPTWLKPLKFAISTCLFSFTLAFLIGRLKRTRRFAAPIGSFMAIALVLEIVLIDLQAARHTASHFNNETAFDISVYGFMGIGIAVVLLGSILILIATSTERFEDRSLGWALRLGMALALAGMATGALMTLPSKQQLADMKSGKPIPRVGAHTVGAPDGGPGMPVTQWSVDHGDLRIAHFVGLHAAQLLLLGWWLAFRSGWPSQRRLRLIWAIAFSTAGIFAIVLTQALRGQPFLEPDLSILQSWLIWLALTTALLIWAIRQTDDLKSNRRMQ
jgi:hypothetical protein